MHLKLGWDGDLSLKFSFGPLCSTVVAALKNLVSHLNHKLHGRWHFIGVFLVLTNVKMSLVGDNCRTLFLNVVSTFLLLDAAAKIHYNCTVSCMATSIFNSSTAFKVTGSLFSLSKGALFMWGRKLAIVATIASSLSAPT